MNMRKWLMSLCAAGIGATAAWGAVPIAVNYQGRLLDSAGNPITSNVTFSVGLYTNAVGGTPVYEETVGVVPVLDSLYAFQFGSDVFEFKAALAGPECWLEVRVGGLALAPRHRLLAVPYALRSSEVDAVGTNAVLADGIVSDATLADGAVTVAKLDPDVDARYLHVAGGGMSGALTNPAGFYGNGSGLTNLQAGVYPESDPVFSRWETNEFSAFFEQLGYALDSMGQILTNDHAIVTNHVALTTGAHGGIVAWDDYRLTNARAPSAHTQDWSTITGAPDFATNPVVRVESDPFFDAWLITNGYVKVEVDPGFVAWLGTNGYVKVEADPLFGVWLGTNTYVKAETDPDFAGWLGTNTYVTLEADPLWTAASNLYLTTNAAASTYVRRNGDTMTGALGLPAGGLSVGTTQWVVLANGNVGIGTSTPTNKLSVNGTIMAREVIVTLDGWPDYVFDRGYVLMPLNQIERYVQEYGHLPDVPSARQVQEGGVPVGKMQSVLLRKVEELTLHLVEMQKENNELRRRIERMETRPALTEPPPARGRSSVD